MLGWWWAYNYSHLSHFVSNLLRVHATINFKIITPSHSFLSSFFFIVLSLKRLEVINYVPLNRAGKLFATNKAIVACFRYYLSTSFLQDEITSLSTTGKILTSVVYIRHRTILGTVGLVPYLSFSFWTMKCSFHFFFLRGDGQHINYTCDSHHVGPT